MDQALLAQITSLLVMNLPIRAVYLFGSRAKGNASADSDIDLLLVVKNGSFAHKKKISLLGDAWRVLRKIRLSKDILMYSEDEFNQKKTELNHIARTVVNEGRLLYEQK